MTEREKRDSTSGTGRASTGGESGGQRRQSQSRANRVTYESVRASIGTRQAALLERNTPPTITKQLGRKLTSASLAKNKKAQLSLTISSDACSLSVAL